MEQINLNPVFYAGQSENGYYLFDSKNNLIYDINKIFYEVVTRLTLDNEKELIEKLKNKYPEEEIMDSIKEIKIQLESGILKHKQDYLEPEYSLKIETNELCTAYAKNRNFISDFIMDRINYVDYYNFYFTNPNDENQLSLVINFIEDINNYIEDTSCSVSFYLIVDGSIREDLINKAKKNNLRIIYIIKSERDLAALRKLTNKSELMIKLRALSVDWKQIITALWDKETALTIDYRYILEDLVEQKGERKKFKLLTEKMNQTAELFVNLSDNIEELISIYPFKEKIDLLHNQKRKKYPCQAGRKRFYLRDNRIYPCYKLSTQKLNINKTAVLNNELQTKFYQSPIKNNEECINCFANNLCGGFCYKYGQEFENKKNYCELEKLIVRLSIEVYHKLQS